MVKVGDKSPEFSLDDQRGDQFSLGRFQNKPVVLAFLGGNLNDTVNLIKLLGELAPKVQSAGGELVVAVGTSMSPWPLSEFIRVRELDDAGLTLLDDSKNGDLAQIFWQPNYQLIEGEPVFMGNYSPLVVLSADHTIVWMSSRGWSDDFEECTSKILQSLAR